MRSFKETLTTIYDRIAVHEVCKAGMGVAIVLYSTYNMHLYLYL